MASKGNEGREFREKVTGLLTRRMGLTALAQLQLCLNPNAVDHSAVLDTLPRSVPIVPAYMPGLDGPVNA